MVVEELAGGCLAAAFVLVQHFRLVMTLAAQGTPPALRDRWLTSACQGRTRGGIALTGLIPGPPQLRAEPAVGGWRLDGMAPWVTGWGLIDLVQVVARGPDDTVVTLIMDAAAQPKLTVTRQRLAAVDASVTVRLGFDGVLAGVRITSGDQERAPAASRRHGPGRMIIVPALSPADGRNRHQADQARQPTGGEGR